MIDIDTNSQFFPPLAAARAELDKYDELILGANKRAEAIGVRRLALARELQQLEAGRPADALDAEAALIEAVAADPSAMPDAAALAALADAEASHQKEGATWRRGVALIEKADRALVAELESEREFIAAMKAEQEDALFAFAGSAATYLADGFRSEFKVLAERYLAPLDLIELILNRDGARAHSRAALRVTGDGWLGVSRTSDADRGTLWPRDERRDYHTRRELAAELVTDLAVAVGRAGKRK